MLLKKFWTFYGTQKFITAFTSSLHLSLSWARSILTKPPTHFLTTHLNIILASTPGSSKWSLYLRLPDQNPVHTFPLTPLFYMTRPSHSSRFDYLNNIGWVVPITNLIIYFSPLSCYLDPLRPKYFPQHPIFKHSQPTSLPQCERHLYLSTGIKWPEYEAHSSLLHTIVQVLRTHKFISAVRTCIRGVRDINTVVVRFNKFLEVYMYRPIHISLYTYLTM